MKSQAHAKLVISFCSYRGVVLDADKALAILELIRGAERFESKYHSAKVDGSGSGSGSSSTTMHIYPHDGDEQVMEIKCLTDSQYALAKVSGKPAKD